MTHPPSASSPTRRSPALVTLGVLTLLVAGATAPAALAAPSTVGTIAFVAEVDGDDEIAIMSADGERVRVLTENVGPDRAPTWSADGSSIVFNSRRAPHTTRPQIYRLDPATATATRLTDSTGEDQRASLSVSGELLYLQRGVFFVEPYNLIERNLTTGVETPLTSDVDAAIWNAAPTPSPDGRWLLFQSNRDVPSPSGPFPQTLYALDLATSTITALPFGTGLGASNSIDGPRWSPDGSEFVYSSGGRLFVGSAAGDDPALWNSAPITDGDDDSSPAFSPDGLSIVFQSHVDGDDPDGDDDVTLIRVLERSTGDTVTLGEGRTPAWTARTWLPAEADSTAPELAETGAALAVPLTVAGLALIAGGVIARRRHNAA